MKLHQIKSGNSRSFLLSTLLLTTFDIVSKCNTLLHSIFRINKKNIKKISGYLQPKLGISVYVFRAISSYEDANRILISPEKNTPRRLRFQQYIRVLNGRAYAKVHSKSKRLPFFTYLCL